MSGHLLFDSDSDGKSGETVVGEWFRRGFCPLFIESVRTQHERIEMAVKKSP
jgi:hypothetical protein